LDNSVTVWLLDCAALDEAALAPFEQSLGEDERARLAGFTRPLRRRQFVAGHALLRQALAPSLGLAPSAITLTQARGSAPRLATAAGCAPFFSLSHSGRWVACAVSAGTPIGLDIECLDGGRDVAALAAQAFGAAEGEALAGLGPLVRSACFYRLWCGAEARFKLGTPAAQQCSLAHPALAIVLCSGHSLASAPVLHEVGLAALS